MKKLLLLFVLLFHGIITCFAQGCAYSGAGGCSSNLQHPTHYAISIVQSVCYQLQTSYINIYKANIENACASFASNGAPIITYNPDFMEYLAQNNAWAPISVVAHEVGHHISADLSWYGQLQHPWSRELRADFISGYVMFKLGASLSDAQSAFRVMFDWLGSSSHPDTPKRIDALNAGYYRASLGY